MNFRNFLPPKLIRSLRQNIILRLLRRRSVLKQKNFRIYAEITTLCNARCLMCSRQSLIDKKKMKVINMPDNVLNRLIDSIKKITSNGYNITFVPMGLGEPLLFPGLLTLFHELKEIDKKIYIILTTNGILLNKKTIVLLIKEGVDEITISLNVDNKEGYKKLMGIDKYDLVLGNIVDLLKYKKNNNLNYPKISIQYLDSGYLKKSFFRIIKFWQHYLTKTDKVFFHEIVSEAGAVNFRGKLKNALSDKKRFPCPECWYLIAVHNNGDVYPCSPIFYWKEKKEDLYLGNILEKDIISLYFNNPKLKKIRDLLLSNDYRQLKTCKRCDNIVLMPNPFLKNIFTGEWF